MVDNQRFPTTQWSQVYRAGGKEIDPIALEILLQRYEPALRNYLVFSKGISDDKASDTTQSFIADKILEDGLLGKARKERGKFRSFLLKVLNNYYINQLKYESTQKRSPQTEISELHDNILEPKSQEPDHYFNVFWARQIIDTVLKTMERDCEASGMTRVWEVFNDRVIKPTLHNLEPTPYQILVKELQFQSPVQAGNALVTGKRLFKRILRTVVSEYTTDEESIEQEINDLINILSKNGAG